MELKFDPDSPKYEYVTTPKQLDKVLELLEKEKVVGVDVESSGLDPYTDTLLLVQIGTEDISYVLDARKLNLRESPRYKALIENPKIIKIMHNGKFDYKFIKVQTGAATNNIYDTMLSESVLTAGIKRRPSSLKALAEEYLDVHMDKDVRTTFVNFTGRITEDQLRYSGLDTLVLFPIFKLQLKRLSKENLVKIAKLEFASTVVVAEMELRGVYIEVERWKGIIENLKKKRNKYACEFQDLIRPYYKMQDFDLFGNAVDVININSQAQLMELFNKKLKLNIPSTGDGILSMLDHPVAKTLRDYRGYEKMISAFGDKLLAKVNPVTGRLHPDFMQMGTATGRFSCRDPNLQQIPRNSEEAPFRECFSPAPGYKLITADYSSFEMRILAELSDDAKMIKALCEGLDLHSYTASLMFDVPYSDDFKKKHKDLRQIAKPIGFGLMYGMGPSGLAGQINVTKEEAMDYMDRYFKSYPSVKKFLDRLARDAIRKGWSATPEGRKRWYTLPDREDPDYKRKIAKIQREAKNHPIQGTNADAIKYALVFLKERLEKDGVDGYITHTVHDEIVCEVREDQAEDWAVVQTNEMVRAANRYIHKVPVKSDPFVGDVWEH
jgi:DNA polymerase-1